MWDVTMIDSHEIEEVNALLDSGVTGLFIDRTWLCQKKITTQKLEHPIEVYNIDGSVNRAGSITEEVTLILSYQGHKECCKGGSGGCLIPHMRKYNVIVFLCTVGNM